MTITVRISPFLQDITGDCETVEVDGRSVEECLDELERRFPGIKGHLGWYDDQQFRLFADVSVDVASRSTRWDEVATVLQDGDELTISVTAFGG